MIDVVCFKWKKPGYRSIFTAQHVNNLYRMVQKHYQRPFRFSCVTDDPRGLAPEVRPVQLWDDYANVQSPNGLRFPSCYRRLKLFSNDLEDTFGPHRVWIDLDVVITGDMVPIWDRPDDFVIISGKWEKQDRAWSCYNGSMCMVRAGTRTQVWERFDPQTSPAQSRAAGYQGSDQGWIGFCLGPDEATWGPSDGVYSYRNNLKPAGGRLPENARLVVFHGKHDPWGPEAQRLAWVRDHYNGHVAPPRFRFKNKEISL